MKLIKRLLVFPLFLFIGLTFLVLWCFYGKDMEHLIITDIISASGIFFINWCEGEVI